MTTADMGRDIEGRAEAVREWLAGILSTRGVWLWSELVMAAEKENIDLEWFWGNAIFYIPVEVQYRGGDTRCPLFVRPKTDGGEPPPPATPSRDALAAAMEDLAAKIDRIQADFSEAAGVLAARVGRLEDLAAKIDRMGSAVAELHVRIDWLSSRMTSAELSLSRPLPGL